MRSLTSRVRLDLDQVLNRDVYEAKLGPKKSTEFNPRPTLFKWDPGKLPHVFYCITLDEGEVVGDESCSSFMDFFKF